MMLTFCPKMTGICTCVMTNPRICRQQSANLTIHDGETMGLSWKPQAMSAVPRLFYSTSFGGAVAMTPYHFRRVHGYANTYYSWGREDDDMSARLGIAGLPLHRRDFAFARYTMLKHKHESGNKPNPVRNRRYFRAVKLWRKDRYQHVRYTIVTEGLQHRSLYYLLSVNLHPPYRDFDYAKPRNATRRRPHKQRLNS
uniref:Galactosyltransferase C-terminal domain-containing protein n=1 Tax=Schistocephalus solidus TaxID=70667 RepID=A0A0X3P3G9_SCHSO